jgi:hypothetical protein
MMNDERKRKKGSGEENTLHFLFSLFLFLTFGIGG